MGAGGRNPLACWGGRQRLLARDSRACGPSRPGPGGFSGAVGNFQLSWTADRARTSRDVPITVRLDVRGKGNLPLVRTPPLSGSDFEVFASTVEDSLGPPGNVGPGRKRFQWTLLPRHEGLRSDSRVPVRPTAGPIDASRPCTGRQPAALHRRGCEGGTARADGVSVLSAGASHTSVGVCVERNRSRSGGALVGARRPPSDRSGAHGSRFVTRADQTRPGARVLARGRGGDRLAAVARQGVGFGGVA